MTRYYSLTGKRSALKKLGSKVLQEKADGLTYMKMLDEVKVIETELLRDAMFIIKLIHEIQEIDQIE